MLKNNVFKLILSALFIPIIPLSADNFIFDLGGVLVDTDSMACARHIGLKNIALCMYQLKKGPHTINNHIKMKLFETLNNVAIVQQDIQCNAACAYDEHGNQRCIVYLETIATLLSVSKS